MELDTQDRYSGPVSVFKERRLPEQATPAGYAALIHAYDLSVPLPRILSATGERHRLKQADGWRIYTPRHAPQAALESHLIFALKHEGVDLAVLKRLFLAIGARPIEAIVQAAPTGSYARRIWFLYEWLTGSRLGLADAERGAYAAVIDTKLQYAASGKTSKRHRIKDNLPGTSDFCPLIFRTEALERFLAMNLQARAQEAVSAVPRGLLARTAAFLLLKDSKSSFAIEGESPPQDRIQRWGRAIVEAGKQPIDLYELLRLQRIVIGDARFVRLGLRTEGGFIGEHDRDSRMPIPDHISARHEDLSALVSGMSTFDLLITPQLDPVLAAAMLAFGFVYIHPFEDGNGRVHRYLIHHVLAKTGFSPPGVVFPVSAAILERIHDYRRVLEEYSSRLLPHVEWHPTENGNVRVLNETGDFYRYFDATAHAEFLFECVQKTIEQDLPEETEFLRRHDAFRSKLALIVDMPDRTSDLLFRFLNQNSGHLSQRAREKEFAALSDDEAKTIERLYADIFLLEE
ncbi:MAG: Fic family protein [Rhodospirillales bacterium]|nr:Fic family protein [Rhodospirillales bacterium]